MSKSFFCANCGTCLTLTRKALPEFGRIIDLIEWHECLEEPVELDLTPIDNPPINEEKRSFTNNLENLQSRATVGTLGTDDFRDRRPGEHVKSTAPQDLISQIKNSIPSQPKNDILEDPSDGM